jgi:dephospho-CoA kinase
MLIAGLTGGLACGKSFVADCLAKLGSHIIEADDVGHEVLNPGGEAYDAAIAAFGNSIVNADGFIDRARLAEKVFTNPAELELLNAIVHPAVRQRARRQFQEMAAIDPHGIVTYVVAILIESGAYKEVDKIIVVRCAREQQIERAMKRPGAAEAGVLARLERQMPIEQKLAFADYVIDTSGTKEDTLRQTEVVYEALRKLA